jgi:hypothetical protein
MLTTGQVAKIIKRTPQTVRDMCEAGVFKTRQRVNERFWLVEKWEAEAIAKDMRQRRRF